MKYVPLFLSALLLVLSSALAIAADDEGFYPIVPAQQPRDVPAGKTEVVEFFWYGCSHCYDFEPTLEHWLNNKPDNVMFKRVPAVFRKGMLVHAKAYFTAEMLGITDKVHALIFDTIHKKKQPLSETLAISELMAGASGVALKDVVSTMNSFAVESQVRQAIQMARSYGLRGVPAMAVDGRFIVTGRTAGGYPSVPTVVDRLVRESQSLNK